MILFQSALSLAVPQARSAVASKREADAEVSAGFGEIWSHSATPDRGESTDPSPEVETESTDPEAEFPPEDSHEPEGAALTLPSQSVPFQASDQMAGGDVRFGDSLPQTDGSKTQAHWGILAPGDRLAAPTARGSVPLAGSNIALSLENTTAAGVKSAFEPKAEQIPPIASLSGEAPGFPIPLSPTTPPIQVAPPASPNAPAASAAQQIAASLFQSQGQVTEITLNPEELGRVRIALTTSEAGITVSIISERPETTDLLRRHLDLLEQEFADLGYDSLAFMFDGQRDDSDHQTTPRAANFIEADAAPDDVDLHIPQTPHQTGGLDLKL